MGQGLTLVIVGAVFAFAVRLESKVIDLQVVGLILMLAGAAVMAWSRREVATSTPSPGSTTRATRARRSGRCARR